MKQHHEGDADEAGDERRPQRVLAERGRHGLHGLRLELDREGAAVEHPGQERASPSLKLPVIVHLVGEDRLSARSGPTG